MARDDWNQWTALPLVCWAWKGLFAEGRGAIRRKIPCLLHDRPQKVFTLRDGGPLKEVCPSFSMLGPRVSLTPREDGPLQGVPFFQYAVSQILMPWEDGPLQGIPFFQYAVSQILTPWEDGPLQGITLLSVCCVPDLDALGRWSFTRYTLLSVCCVPDLDALGRWSVTWYKPSFCMLSPRWPLRQGNIVHWKV